MKKILYIFTSNFPFGEGEDFLETELRYLSKAFKEVYIFNSSKFCKITKKIPDNVKIHKIKLDNTYSNVLKYLAIFNIEFWKELFIVKLVYKISLNKSVVCEILDFLYNGEIVYKYIKNYLIKQNSNNSIIYLYSYWFEYYTYGITKLKKYKKDLKVFTRTHRYDLYFEFNKNNYLPMRKVILNNIDGIYFVSKDGLNYFSKKLYTNKKERKKMFLSRLGVDSNEYMKFNNLTLKVIYNRKNTLKILTCSNIIEVKRLDLLIRALNCINDYNIEWIHFGDGNYKHKIISLANKLLNSKTNIKYIFKGRVKNSEIFNYYKDNWVDIFINVSISEGIPVSIMEACSFGIPIIATDVGGNREIVSNRNGFLISANPSVLELKNAIDNMHNMSDDDILKKKKNSYKIWFNYYRANINYNKFIKSILIL